MWQAYGPNEPRPGPASNVALGHHHHRKPHTAGQPRLLEATARVLGASGGSGGQPIPHIGDGRVTGRKRASQAVPDASCKSQAHRQSEPPSRNGELSRVGTSAVGMIESPVNDRSNGTPNGAAGAVEGHASWQRDESGARAQQQLAATGTVDSPPWEEQLRPVEERTCVTCGEVLHSRNALMRHLRDEHGDTRAHRSGGAAKRRSARRAERHSNRSQPEAAPLPSSADHPPALVEGGNRIERSEAEPEAEPEAVPVARAMPEAEPAEAAEATPAVRPEVEQAGIIAKAKAGRVKCPKCRMQCASRADLFLHLRQDHQRIIRCRKRSAEDEGGCVPKQFAARILARSKYAKAVSRALTAASVADGVGDDGVEIVGAATGPPLYAICAEAVAADRVKRHEQQKRRLRAAKTVQPANHQVTKQSRLRTPDGKKRRHTQDGVRKKSRANRRRSLDRGGSGDRAFASKKGRYAAPAAAYDEDGSEDGSEGGDWWQEMLGGGSGEEDGPEGCEH